LVFLTFTGFAWDDQWSIGEVRTGGGHCHYGVRYRWCQQLGWNEAGSDPGQWGSDAV
jgi:hypothetical protein